MNKQFLKENKWTLLAATLNTIVITIVVHYGTKNLVENIKELKGGK